MCRCHQCAAERAIAPTRQAREDLYPWGDQVWLAAPTAIQHHWPPAAKIGDQATLVNRPNGSGDPGTPWRANRAALRPFIAGDRHKQLPSVRELFYPYRQCRGIAALPGWAGPHGADNMCALPRITLAERVAMLREGCQQKLH